MVSLGFLKFLKFLESKLAPQFMQVSFTPKFIVPHSEQVFSCELKEFKPKNAIKNINSGIKNISNKIFPTKLMKNLNPKMGTTIKKIKE